MFLLTFTDESGNLTEFTNYLFETEEQAKGWAARKGNLLGYWSYKLDGKSFKIDPEDTLKAGEPVWKSHTGKTVFGSETDPAFMPPRPFPTNPATHIQVEANRPVGVKCGDAVQFI